jgi:hypothetical protein
LAACYKAKCNFHGALEHSEKPFDLSQKFLSQNDPTRTSIQGNLIDSVSLVSMLNDFGCLYNVQGREQALQLIPEHHRIRIGVQ